MSRPATVGRALLAQVASIPITGLFLWTVARPPHLHEPVLVWLLRYSVSYAAAALLCSGAICFVASLQTLAQERSQVAKLSLRVVRAALWCAPIVILFRRFPPGAIVAAVALSISTTRFLYANLRSDDASPDPELGENGVGAPMAVSAALHGSCCAFLLRSTGLFPVLLVLTTAMGTALLLSRGERRIRPSTLPRSLIALAATFVVCVALIFVGVVARYSRGAGGFGFGLGEASAAAGAPGEKAPGGVPKESPENPEWAALGAAEGGYPGVILWPRIKPVTTLIEPVPTGAGFAQPFARQHGIPFGGEYWMYRGWWTKRPPANSFRQRGSPVALSFSTTDGLPLQMEARHRFDQPVGIRCCREIQMEIRNGDAYSGGIALELILTDLQSGATQTLGREPVRSRPDTQTDPPMPAIETLTFRIPPSPSIQQFDLLRVLFLRMNHADKSARIAIERFVLIP